MPTRRRTDPLKRITIYIDPAVLAEIRGENPEFSVGRVLEALWRECGRPTPKQARVVDLKALKVTTGPTPVTQAPKQRRRHVMGTLMGKWQCKHCGSTDETTYCT